MSQKQTITKIPEINVPSIHFDYATLIKSEVITIETKTTFQINTDT